MLEKSIDTADHQIFSKHVLKKAKNLKLIFFAFAQLSRFKINFHKNELLYFLETPEFSATYAELFVYEQV
jgi:hypothetical protein